MSIGPGARLGPYEILSAIGVGGMGEVYRARDTKLGRDVALKVLPERFAADPDRLARFAREAHVLASLNHPNIAAIYGIEEAPAVGPAQAGPYVETDVGAGFSRPTRALVLELVEGPTLDDRIHHIPRPDTQSPTESEGPHPKGGGLPLDEALPIARQIAEALAYAHEQGIVHRDLKPANVKVREDGTVKVLDFGLAKLTEAQGLGPEALDDQVPTMTSPAIVGTAVGVILGTAAYMAPEQAKGRAADKRSDIWAFGAVLYEMLTGRRAFEGEDLSDTLANVLKSEPDWNALPADLPAAIRVVLQRCLAKDRRQRIGDIAAALFVLNEGASLTSGPRRDGPAALDSARAREAGPYDGRATWRRVALIGGTALVLGAAVAGTAVWLETRPVSPQVTRTAIVTTGAAAMAFGDAGPMLAVTPDGTRVVYVGNRGTQLFVRPLDSLDPVAIATGGPAGLFLSPDGQWVGFFENLTVLKKVAITGGPPVTLATLDGPGRGAVWLQDDSIIFTTLNPTTGLQRVSASGGTPEVLTRPAHAQGEADHLFPELLPGGRAVLFTITAQTGGLDAAQIAVRDLRTGTQKILVRGGTHAHYTAASGHLLYAAGGTLRAVPFDLDRLEVRGTAVPVVPKLATTRMGAALFAVSNGGTLVYVDSAGSLAGSGRTLVWVDRSGREEAIAAPPRPYFNPRLSPDGTRVALYSIDEDQDLWIWNLRGGVLSRVTSDPAQDALPTWTVDGRRIIFYSIRGASGSANLWWQAADGTGTAEPLAQSSHAQFAGDVTPDGTQLVFTEEFPQTTGTNGDLFRLALDGTHRVTPLLQTPFWERNPTVSPDGRWIAYQSNASGHFEIYVRPFPDVTVGQWQLSTAGGTRPLWARSGKELFFVAPDDALMRVPVEVNGSTWSAGTATKILDGRYYMGGQLTAAMVAGRNYDVSPDGQRFLLLKPAAADQTGPAPSLIVVQHFDQELKARVPVK